MKPHSQTDERLFLSIKERQLYPPYPAPYDASHQQWLLFVIGIVLCHGSFSPMMKQRLTLKWEHDTSTTCNRRMLKRSMPTRSHHATPCEAYWAGERLWIWIISTAFLFLHSLQVEGKGCRTSGRIDPGRTTNWNSLEKFVLPSEGLRWFPFSDKPNKGSWREP